MIVGIGIDIVDNERFRRKLDDHLAGEIFLPGERSYSMAQARPWLHLAARMAAKSAASKALGESASGGMDLREIEIVRSPDGMVSLKLHGRAQELAEDRGVVHGSVSLAHEKGISIATVILEGRED